MCQRQTEGTRRSGKVATGGFKVRSILLDVTDQRTIDAAAAEVDRTFGKLDYLVNNAGIVAERTPPSECQIENCP